MHTDLEAVLSYVLDTEQQSFDVEVCGHVPGIQPIADASVARWNELLEEAEGDAPADIGQTLQDLARISHGHVYCAAVRAFDALALGPRIHWQTGMPTEYGTYLVTDGEHVAFDCWWLMTPDRRALLPAALANQPPDVVPGWTRHDGITAWAVVKRIKSHTH